MSPLKELYFNDWKQWIDGTITMEEFEQRIESYKTTYGEEEFNALFTAHNDVEPTYNMAESWEGFEQLDDVAKDGWLSLSSSLPNSNEDIIGRFMYAWLTAEHCMNTVLFQMHQINKSEAQEIFEHIPFWKRLNSLPKYGKLYSPYLRLLGELSKVRNGLVHSLKFRTDDMYIGKELSLYLSKTVKGRTREDVLISLLYNIRFYFLLETTQLREKRNEILQSNPSLQALLNAAQK